MLPAPDAEDFVGLILLYTHNSSRENDSLSVDYEILRLVHQRVYKRTLKLLAPELFF
jgi:hypothetical protein